MRIFEASWEYRNLGVVTYEGEIVSSDSPEDVHDSLASLPDGYHVMKVPVGEIELMFALEEAGFSFIETSLRVHHNLRLTEPAGLLKRLIGASSLKILNKAGIYRVEQEIRKGIFRTDRVSLDPRINSERAALRYLNWLRDELEKGAHVHELSVSGRRAGFFLLRIGEDGVAHSVLSGLYDSSKTPGLGGLLLYWILTEASRRATAGLWSHISTNNPAVVKTHLDQGFAIEQINYVYVRRTAST